MKSECNTYVLGLLRQGNVVEFHNTETGETWFVRRQDPNVDRPVHPENRTYDRYHLGTREVFQVDEEWITRGLNAPTVVVSCELLRRAAEGLSTPPRNVVIDYARRD